MVAYRILPLIPQTPLGDAVQFFIMDVAKIFVMLILVIYIMGLFRSFVSPEKVRLFIQGKSRFTARILAILLGSVTPFCSCSSVPLFIGFVEAGIPLGVTFSFLIASPMISEVAVVMLLGVVGWQVTVLYVGAGLLVAFFGGMLIEQFRPERWVESYVWDIKMGQAAELEEDRSFKGRHQYAWGEVREIVGRIWIWVLVGVGAGAAFHGFFPREWVEVLSGQNSFLAVPLAVILGVPLYSNAIGVIPLAEAMLGKGVAMGTTLAFMMSIAAISLPEILILKKILKWQAQVLFVGVISLSIMLVGWLFNMVL